MRSKNPADQMCFDTDEEARAFIQERYNAGELRKCENCFEERTLNHYSFWLRRRDDEYIRPEGTQVNTQYRYEPNRICEFCVGSNDTFIYGLIDPRTNEYFYVGATRTLEYRYSAHCNPATKDYSRPRVQRILSIKADGMLPQIKVLDRAKTLQRHECEQRWICKLLLGGSPLTNEAISWDIYEQVKNEMKELE
jgi:predicted GIY-YIG superfamily endonuclease